jgi:hypothetical protein
MRYIESSHRELGLFDVQIGTGMCAYDIEPTDVASLQTWHAVSVLCVASILVILSQWRTDIILLGLATA